MIYSRLNHMDKIEELLTRGVDTIYPSKDELEKVLHSGKKLKLYQGFDPTGTQLHIGHMVGLRKLAQWQRLGHHVIFLIGDGTGQAGDPSGKTKSRDTFMTRDELRQNARDYVMQAKRIVSFEGKNPVEIKYNGDWLNKLELVDMLDIIGNFSLQQLIERDLFQERMKRNESINLREFIYPLLQAYDSVAMKVDLELGGNDQTFNMLTGRTLIKAMLKKEKYVMTTPLLADSSGRKIGKSEGNAIAIGDKPEELFKKIMTLGDEVIVLGLECLTDIPMDEVEKVKKALADGANPIDFKKLLAFEIVKQLNSIDDATQAQIEFERTVQNRELPNKIENLQISIGSATLVDIVLQSGVVSSKSEAKRLIEQGGVEIDDEKITDAEYLVVNIKGEKVLKVGKRNFFRLVRK